MPSKMYVYDKPTQSWKRPSEAPITIVPSQSEQPGDPFFRPVSFATLEDARVALDAPADANYVIWNHGAQTLEQVFASLGANDILVLPERPEPYWIDSSNGFMAAGVKEVSGPNNTRTSIVSNPRLWFAMSRARRGILGMGPGVVIAPTDSGYTAPAQPYPQTCYMLDGSTDSIVGSSNKLIEVAHAYPFFANFTLQGRSFGGISYHGIASSSRTHTVIRRVYFDGCWRGFSDIPNGETGGASFNRGTYLIENCDFRSQNGSSPIMWNLTTGGTVRTVRSSQPNYGMWTFWRCYGVNIFEDVWMDADTRGVNIEEDYANFELRWTGGKMDLHGTGNRFHLNINPSNGSIKVSLQGVACSPNGYTANTMVAHVYSTAGMQRRGDITCDNATVAYVPAANWIN